MPFWPGTTTGDVPAARQINTTAPLAGGGALSGDLTLSIVAASASVPGSMSAADFAKLAAVVNLKAGTDLTNADVTKNPASDAASVYTLPAATLSANHTVTLGTTGSPVTGSICKIIRRDLTAHTYAVINGGAGAGTKLTFASAPATAQGATFSFDGTNWALVDFFYVAA